MSNEDFKTEFKKWLNHKIILSQTSKAFTIPFKRDAIFYAKNKFSSFLTFSKNYSIGQLAIDIKRNQSILENILPIPNNPGYEASVNMLHEIINKASELVKELRLTDIIN